MMDEAELFLSIEHGMYMRSLFARRRSRSWRCVGLWAIVAPVRSAGCFGLFICTFQASFHAVVARTIFFAALVRSSGQFQGTVSSDQQKVDEKSKQ